MPPHSVESAFIRISGNSGYSRHGDTVSLYVDRIDNRYDAGVTSGSLAVQLWACPAPYAGGNLTGWKLAEAKLGILEANHFIAPVKSDVPACFPEHGDYAIVLVIAEWDGKDFNLIHDYHNYPCRDVFLHPRLEGLVAYRCTHDDRLVVDVERIHNPRDPGNLSGTLALEFWALSEPYVVGDFSGHALAAVGLGTLAGGETWQYCSYDMEISSPPPGTYTLVLMLREWTVGGYINRDHCNFKDRVTFPLVAGRQSLPERMVTDNTDEEVGYAVPPRQAVTAAIVAAQAGSSTNISGATVQQSTESPGTPDASETVSLPVLLANIKKVTQSVLEKIKQQFAI